MKPAILPMLLLAACSQTSDSPASNEANAVTSAPATKAQPPAKAFSLDEKNDQIEFHFGWSAEAAAVPQLVDRFGKDLAKVRSELIAGAREDEALRAKDNSTDFTGHSSSTDYQTAGQSPRLLSLLVEVASYTGGAHGNYGTNALLWDRQKSKDIQIGEMFASPANFDRVLTQRWCDALNKAREEKRGEPVGGDGMFDECPKLSEIAIIPTDKNKDGQFEVLMLVASPYVAGPYSEGSYEIELGVTTDLLAALKDEYRPSFDAR